MGSQTNEQERTNFAAVSSTSQDTNQAQQEAQSKIFICKKKKPKENEPRNCGLK